MHEIVIKNKKMLQKMRKAGELLAGVFAYIAPFVKEGISTLELDSLIEAKMLSLGLRPECKGYAGVFSPFRHASCISVNDVVVHGVPAKEIVLKSGDFVKIDVVGSYERYCADMARQFFVGEVSDAAKRMALVAQEALDRAISLVRPGARLSDISAAVQAHVEGAGFGVVRCFSGHGIGRAMHEAPDVPNYGKPGQGPVLREGMTLAIEPMITQGDFELNVMPDGWTAKTRDGGLGAHVEDTVVVTRDGAEILTRLQ